MNRLLIWLSGAQPDLLARAPGDRAKYQGIGGAVLTTACLAGISMFFALRMAVDAPWWAALPISMVWFLAILNLDRWLVVSIQRGQRAWLVAAPRLLLALLFGFVISTPLVLQIFRPEVETEINKIRLEQTERFQGDLTGGATGKKIKELEGRETALLATIGSGGTVVNPESDPQIVALRTRLTPLEQKRDENADAATCELTGDKCKNGSRKSGAGPRYENFKAKQRDAERQILVINRQIDARTEELQDSARTSRTETLREAQEALPGIQTQLKDLRRIQTDEQRAFESANEENTGLLVRLKALNRASAGDFTLGLWRILLFLLITVIECLPIFVKVLQLWGPRTTYEELVEVDSRRRIKDESLDDTSQFAQAQALAEARERSAKDLGRLTADAELRVATAILAAWEERELRNIPANLDSYVSTSSAPAAPVPSGPPMGGVTPYYAPAYDENARRSAAVPPPGPPPAESNGHK